jgi:hypothetical protein
MSSRSYGSLSHPNTKLLQCDDGDRGDRRGYVFYACRRRRGLMQWEHGWFFLPDIASLADVAKFDLDAPRRRPLL